MQKFYILLSLVIFTFSASRAADPSASPTWDVIQFDPSEWVNGKRTLIIDEDYKVNVTLQRHQFETLTSACIVLDKEYATFNYVTMFDDASLVPTNANNRAYSAYVMFEPVGDFRITKIDLIGHARGAQASSLVLGISVTDTTYSTGRPPKDDFITSDAGGPTAQLIDFNPAYTGTDICEVVEMPIGSGDADFQREVKFIRLNWNNARFAGYTVDRGTPLDLFGFRIYTDITVTGIEDVESNNYAMVQRGDVLEFTEMSDIEIYSLSGKLVTKVRGVTEVSVDSFQRGAYVIKAKSLENNTLLVEKILR